MTNEELRIKVLESIGWTNLGWRHGVERYALRGTSPDGVENMIPSNPTTSLDSIHKIMFDSFSDEERIEYTKMVTEHLKDKHVLYADCVDLCKCYLEFIKNKNGTTKLDS